MVTVNKRQHSDSNSFLAYSQLEYLVNIFDQNAQVNLNVNYFCKCAEMGKIARLYALALF
jgi:hypothetical protein